MFELFEGAALGFGDHELHPDELENHHEAEKQEDESRMEFGHHRGEEKREQGCENPMRETADGLAVGAEAVGEDFGNENPANTHNRHRRAG